MLYTKFKIKKKTSGKVMGEREIQFKRVLVWDFSFLLK